MPVKSYALVLFLVSYILTANSTTICSQYNTACALHFDRAGSLIDSTTKNRVAKEIDNPGVLFDTSIYKYGDQYALIRESRTSDRIVMAIPLNHRDKEWTFDSIYYFSISALASTGKPSSLWVARKISTPQSKIIDDILARAGDLASEQKFDSLVPSGSPDTILYISTDRHKEKGEQCFVPFDSQDSSMPMDLISCTPIKPPLNDGYYDLSGMIGKRIFIDMQFTKIGDSIFGEYRYPRRHDKPIRIKGTLRHDGTLAITEFGGAGGEISGYYNGSLDTGNISGKWESRDKSRNLPFSLYIKGFPR